MVAARSRMMAVAFIALLLVSVLPSTNASHTTGHDVTILSAVMERSADGTSWAPVTAGSVVKAGDRVRFNIEANVPRCNAPTGDVDPTSVTVTINTANRLHTADIGNSTPIGPTAPPYTAAQHWWVAIPGAGIVGTDIFENNAAQTFTATVAVTCPLATNAPTAAPATTVSPTAGVIVDNKLPVWTGDNAATYDHAAAIAAGLRAANAPVATGTIGSVASFNVGASDGSTTVAPLTYKLNVDGLVGGTAGLVGSSAGTKTYEIKAANTGTPAWPTHSAGAANTVTVEVKDTYGNVLTKTITTNIDNVAPTPTNLVAGAANLTLSQYVSTISGSENNQIRLGWQSSDADIAFAQLLVSATGAAPYWPIANLTEPADEFTLGAAVSFTHNDGSPGDDNLVAPWAFKIRPVDASGNVGQTVERAIAFPTMDVKYGILGNSPSFVGGSLVGNVYVNITNNANAPGVPFDYPYDPDTSTLNPTGPGAFFGQLVRETAGTPTYWIVSTAGSQNDHFSSSPVLVPQAAGSTVFRPDGQITSLVTQPFILNNLSSFSGHTRNFVDGTYQLRLTVAGANMHNVTHVMRFKTDSGVPTSANHPLYSSPAIGTVGANTNMTQLHGMDGNPFRVIFHVADERNETVGAAHPQTYVLKDSGLRNVTFELIDQQGNVVRRTKDGAFARVNINVTPGATDTVNVPAAIYDFRTAPAGPPTGGCPAAADPTHANVNHPYCVYHEIETAGKWRASFYNATRFGGWVNLTWPDLPSGNFSIRVLAYDQAGLAMTARSYQTSATDYYVVAPAVKMITGTNTPFLRADNKLDVEVAASQRHFVPPAEVADDCVSVANGPNDRRDLCPTGAVRIYVSNSDAANAVGVHYQTRSFQSGITPALGQDPEYVKGFTGNYSSCRTGVAHPPGQLDFCDPSWDAGKGVPMRYFVYKHDSIEALPTLPTEIDLSQPIFVRAEAVAIDGAGNEIVKRTTSWVRVVTATTPSLLVNQPPVEWALNLTTDPISGAVIKVPFNVSFDRKSEQPVPKMRIEVYMRDDTTKQWATTALLVLPERDAQKKADGSNARFLFNWTGFLTTDDPATTSTDERGTLQGVQLPAGSYRIVTYVYDGTFNPATPLAKTVRHFSVLDEKPELDFGTQSGPGITLPSSSTTHVVGTTFDVTFQVDQGETNLTSLDQIKFRLRQGSAITENGQGGFSAVVRATPLDGDETTSTLTATITLPSAAPNGARFQLNATANLDVFPYTIGNASGFLEFIVDKQVPAGAFLAPDTDATIRDAAATSSTGPTNKVPTKPVITGFAEDLGAGVALVEVRLVDLTTSETLALVGPAVCGGPADNSGVIRLPGTNGNAWHSTADVVFAPSANTPDCPSATVQVIEKGAASAGRLLWTLPLTTGSGEGVRDSPLPALYVHDSNGGKGALNLSHTYRIDVRVTDGLGQVGAINSTIMDLDPTSPHLGYKSQLGVPVTLPSGIALNPSTKTQVNWHGANGDSVNMTVKVTDNHCIREVRLVGNSSKDPSTTVKAVMRPYQLATGTTYTLPADHTKICPNGQAVGYYLELGQAINMLTGVHLLNDVANYTFWFEAEDWAGQVSEVELNHRLRKIEVLDNSPAVVRQVLLDPPVGQAGGRALIRANVSENLAVSHVTVEVRRDGSSTVLATFNMTEDNVTSTGSGIYRADTTDDLGITLDVGVYSFSVTAYDINWNRTNNPTCTNQFCQPLAPLYVVRDDGAPAVVLESPAAGATLNATPTIKFRALHKALETSQISVRATTDGNQSNLTIVPASELSFTELLSTNGSRQGWTVAYKPGELEDNTTLIVNVSAALASLADSKEYSFVVDSLAPSVTGNASNTQTIGGKVYATRATRIVLGANDTVSMPTIKYTVNGGAEQTYSGPITPSGSDGLWELQFWATDPAGNVGAKQTLSLNLDLTGPRITVAKHGDELLVTVADGTGVGLNESTVTVHYRYGAATAFTPKKLDKLTGNSFGTTLPGNASEDGLAYYFTAEDLLSNVGSNFSAAQPYTIRKENTTPTNLPPTIRITAPTAVTSVTSSVEVRWLAEDPEEAPLTISIALRDPAPGRVLVAAGENSGTYTLNTTGFASGAYTVVVTANDGENSASAQVTFNVENTPAIQARNVPPATVLPNTPVSVAVALNPAGKTVQQAQYRLLKDGEVFTSGLLSPSSGLYAAAFTPTEAGNYQVLVAVVYTDGTTEAPQQVASFRVPGETTDPDPTTRGAFPVSLMALAAIAILTVALAAYGAFGRWKK